MPPKIPKTIGKYRIDGLIGQGGMGAVFKGFDEDIARPVAVKVLHPHMGEDESAEELVSRFKREAQAAARCMHGNIVTVFDFGTTAEGAQYIVMEYIDGPNLKSLLKHTGPLPCYQAFDVIRQVLAALEYAHGHGVVHRDIKPANIMILKNGSVKVADFGVAKIDTSELTNAGAIIGTMSYMSPEGRAGRAVDNRSDLYSVGVVFCEMLTNVRPLPSTEAYPMLKKNLLDTIRNRSAVDAISGLLCQVLEQDVDQRFQSAKEFIKALIEIDLPDEDLLEATESLEQTVINSGLANKVVVTPSGSKPSSESHPSQPTLDTGVVDKLIEALTPFLGPLAQRLVQRYAKTSASVPELINELASQIPNATQRGQFLAAVKAYDTGTGGSGSQGKTAGSEFATPVSGGTPSGAFKISDEGLAQVSALMAEYVGPLATRISKAASRKSGTWEQFAEELGKQIPHQKERERFLAKLKTILVSA